MSASGLPQCHKCGNSKGPWRPTGETLPGSDEQALVCSTGCPAELAAAVDAAGGALPMPVGTADEPMPAGREKEIREHIATMVNFSFGNLAARELLAEVDALRARVAELEAQAAKVVADRDAQIIAWLVKKSAEYRGNTRESAADALARMADKLHRGAVRPPVPTVPRPRRFFSGSPLEDQHDSPLHHTYETPRDLPAQRDRRSS